MSSDQSSAGFPDTSWTLIEAVSQTDHPNRVDALRRLAEGYWPAVYAYLRSHGKPTEMAADIAQAFFADVVLHREMFAQADQSKGRLRALVLGALKNFIIDVHRLDRNARHDQKLLANDLQREDRLLASSNNGVPEHAFDRRWALAMLEEAMRRCEAQCRANGKSSHWQAFEMRVVHPSISMTPPPSYEQIAAKLGMGRADDAVQAVRVVRKRAIMLLRQIAMETASNADEQHAEFNHVISLLS